MWWLHPVLQLGLHFFSQTKRLFVRTNGSCNCAQLLVESRCLWWRGVSQLLRDWVRLPRTDNRFDSKSIIFSTGRWCLGVSGGRGHPWSSLGSGAPHLWNCLERDIVVFILHFWKTFPGPERQSEFAGCTWTCCAIYKHFWLLITTRGGGVKAVS